MAQGAVEEAAAFGPDPEIAAAGAGQAVEGQGERQDVGQHAATFGLRGGFELREAAGQGLFQEVGEKGIAQEEVERVPQKDAHVVGRDGGGQQFRTEPGEEGGSPGAVGEHQAPLPVVGGQPFGQALGRGGEDEIGEGVEKQGGAHCFALASGRRNN